VQLNQLPFGVELHGLLADEPFEIVDALPLHVVGRAGGEHAGPARSVAASSG
jgi:hypothetical protein